MHWLILTLFAIISRAFLSISTKVLSGHIKVSSTTLTVLFMGTGGLLSILTIPFFGLSLDGVSDNWLPLSVIVLSQSVANILYFKGLKLLDVGTSQIAFSSILIWSSVLSVIFLDSSFALIQILGIILLLLSILTVQYEKGSRKLNIGVIYIICSTALYAATGIASAVIADKVATGTYLLIIYFGPVAVLGTIYFGKIKRDIRSISSNKFNASRLTLLASLTSFGTFIFLYNAYQRAPDRGIVLVLSASQVVLSVLLGALLLNERKNLRRKFIAALLALLSAALIIQ